MWGSCNIRRDVYIFEEEIIGTGPNFWYTRAFAGQCLAPPQNSRAFTVNLIDANLKCLKELVMAESTLHKGGGGSNYPWGVLLHIWDLDCGGIHWSREMGYEDGDIVQLHQTSSPTLSFTDSTDLPAAQQNCQAHSHFRGVIFAVPLLAHGFIPYLTQVLVQMSPLHWGLPWPT